MYIKWTSDILYATGHVPLASNEVGKLIPVSFHFIKALGFISNQRTFSKHICSRPIKLPPL